MSKNIYERVQPVGLIWLSCNWVILHNKVYKRASTSCSAQQTIEFLNQQIFKFSVSAAALPKFILWNQYADPAQVLAFLSSLQASREARVRDKQKERKMAEMFYSEQIRKVSWILEETVNWTPITGLYGSHGTRTVGKVVFNAFFFCI